MGRIGNFHTIFTKCSCKCPAVFICRSPSAWIIRTMNSEVARNIGTTTGGLPSVNIQDMSENAKSSSSQFTNTLPWQMQRWPFRTNGIDSGKGSGPRYPSSGMPPVTKMPRRSYTRIQIMSGFSLLIGGIVLVIAGALSRHGLLTIWGVFGGIWAIGFGYALLQAGYLTWREDIASRHGNQSGTGYP